MIGRLRGMLLEKHAPDIVLEAGGVGYELQLPMSSIYRLPAVGEQVILYTHFVVREDAQLLFGFADREERALFRDLLKVNGVGPKLALAILSSMNVNEFVRCVREDNSAALVRLPGVGKKTAERLLVEMRDRLKQWQLDENAVAGGAPAPVTDSASEAEQALIALGYKPQEAARAVAAAARDGAEGSEGLIRQALKNMVKP